MPGSCRFVSFRLLSLSAALLLAAACERKPPPAPAKPPEVEVAKVVVRDEPVVQEWIGTLDGYVNAEIRAQVTGYLMRQDYVEGRPVKKGALLYEIDPRPFQAAYDQVKANFGKAELDLKRQSELIRDQVAARQDYDNAVQADLAGKAALQEAQLNLGFTRITSPVDGIAGIATTQIGDLVGSGSGVLTTVSQVDPIKVYFPISERTYLDLFGRNSRDPKFLSGIQWELILDDGSVYPRKGKYFAADREVNPQTGTLRMVAIFPNPDLVLRPGQYGRIRAVVRVERNALLVPQRAVSELQGGYQVAVVDPSNRVHLRTVTVGNRFGPLWLIRSGIGAQDVVVVEGLQRVHEGTEVATRRYDPAAHATEAE